jgi:hypothetical protein
MACKHEIKLVGPSAKEFNRNQIKEMREFADSSKTMRYIQINKLIINDSIKVGLYRYKVFNDPLSVYLIYKVLKFQNKIVLPSNNSFRDRNEVQLFINLYGKYFSKEELNEIQNSFFKGAEAVGRFL